MILSNLELYREMKVRVNFDVRSRASRVIENYRARSMSHLIPHIAYEVSRVREIYRRWEGVMEFCTICKHSQKSSLSSNLIC